MNFEEPKSRNFIIPNKLDSKEIIENNNEKGEKLKNKDNNRKQNISKENNNDNILNKNKLDPNYKTINLFEFKRAYNTIEYHLNCSLKSSISISEKILEKLDNQSLIQKYRVNNEINKAISPSKNITFSKFLTAKAENKDMPLYNILEHHMPLSDEKKISDNLKSITYFQEQNQNIIDSILNEIIYLVIPKGVIIYDSSDISNFYYIIIKGKAKLVKIKKNNKEKDINFDDKYKFF